MNMFLWRTPLAATCFLGLVAFALPGFSERNALGQATAAISASRAYGEAAREPSPRAVTQNRPVRWMSEYDALRAVGAPVTQSAMIRHYGPVDLGGGGTVVGNGDEPAIDTQLYGAYYNPSFIGYGNYASYGGFGYGGFPAGLGSYGGYRGIGGYASGAYGGAGYTPLNGGAGLGWTNYPPWLYRPRYFYPYRYYPLRTGFSVYNPYFYYNNTWYGRYANPFWSGYGGFAFPYQFGSYQAPYSFGGFGYPYSYGVFGYPYPGLFRSIYNYLPTYAYFMYPGLGGLYVPPGYYGFPGYYGYAGYGIPVGSLNYAGSFYW